MPRRHTSSRLSPYVVLNLGVRRTPWKVVSAEATGDFYLALVIGLLDRLDRSNPRFASWLRAELGTLLETFLQIKASQGQNAAVAWLSSNVARARLPRTPCSDTLLLYHYQEGLDHFTRTNESKWIRKAKTFLSTLARDYPCRCERRTDVPDNISAKLAQIQQRGSYDITFPSDFVMTLLAHHHGLTYDGLRYRLKAARRGRRDRKK